MFEMECSVFFKIYQNQILSSIVFFFKKEYIFIQNIAY